MRFYGGLPTQWLEQPLGNLITSYLAIPHVRDTELIFQRAYLNADKDALDGLRRDLGVTASGGGGMEAVRAAMTPEQRKKHDDYVARHR